MIESPKFSSTNDAAGYSADSAFRRTMTNLKRVLFSVLLLYCTLISNANSDERWYVDATLNGMVGSYSDSALRDNFYSGSAWLNVDYIDIYSFAIAYNHLNITSRDAVPGAFDITQDAVAGRFQYYFYNDTLGGKITAQLVVHDISNDAPMTLANSATVIAPKIAYMHYDHDLYFDLEYVDSSYSDNVNFSIQQISSAIGFGFNKNYDWLQFKAYLIESGNKLQTQGESSLTSVDIKWTHWFSSPGIFAMDHFFIDVMAGERIFAVDNDSFSVYNLEDVQQESALLGLGWRAGEDVDVTAVLAVEKYKNKLIDDAYDRQYLYINLTRHW